MAEKDNNSNEGVSPSPCPILHSLTCSRMQPFPPVCKLHTLTLFLPHSRCPSSFMIISLVEQT